MAAVVKNHRVGYIGFGSMANHYHYDTAMREDVPFEAAAVFDVDPDIRKLAEERNLKAFDNLRDFLDSHLFDFVVVATSNQFHCEYTCAALEAGYSVMCEKPAAMSSAEIERMIETSKRTGKLLTFHQNRRVDRDFLMLKEALAKCDIGRVYAIEDRIGNRNSSGSIGGWRRYANHGGGMLLDWGVHMLDQTLYLIDEPIKSVWAQVETIRSEEVDDYAKIIIRFESGLVAQVESMTFAPLLQPKWTVYGTKGMISIGDIEGHDAKVRYIGRSHTETASSPYYTHDAAEKRDQPRFCIDEWEEHDLPFSDIPQDWATVYKNVGAALDGKEPLIVTPESVLRCFKVIEAAFKSSKEGRSIDF